MAFFIPSVASLPPAAIPPIPGSLSLRKSTPETPISNMAIVNLGNLDIPFDGSVILSPQFPLVSGFRTFVIVRTVPLVQIIDYGYLLITPLIIAGNRRATTPVTTKFYPVGEAISFNIPAWEAYGNNPEAQIQFKGIEIYPGRATPDPVIVNVSYEDSAVDPV